MTISFKYIIDLEVCKTEEDPQEQLQLKVQSGQSPNQTHEQDRGMAPEDLKSCSSVDVYCLCTTN